MVNATQTVSIIKSVAGRLFQQTTLTQLLSRAQGQRICTRCQHGNCLEVDTVLLQSGPCENR